MTYQFRLREEPFDFSSEFDEYEGGLLEREPEFEPEFDETALADFEEEEEARRGPRAAGSTIRGRTPPMQLRLPPPRSRRPPRTIIRPWRVSAGVIHEPVTCICPEPTCPEHGEEYIRWVQSALNHVLGLRLPVNGVMGPETRSAVRSFQERGGLPVTGIVGPDIESALIAARGGKSHGAEATKPAEPGMPESAEPATTSPATEFDFEWEVGATKAKHGDRQSSKEKEKCKQDWDKLLSPLPEDVRNALNNEDWNNAIILAIHHGIRDLTTLTRIIFHAKYGKNRGYCKLKNNQADAKYKQYWNQEKSSIRGMMARPSPPLAQKGGIVCRKVERKLGDPKPDNPRTDITGRYENQFKFNGKILTDWTVSINQAGRHIEGIITKVLYPDPRPRGWLFHPDDNPKDRLFTEIYGDLQSDGSFLFFDKRNPSGNWGYFRFENAGLNWELSGKSKSRLVAISKTPTLMNTAPIDKLVWLHEKFPLTRLQIKHLVINLADYKIATYLQNYFTTPAGIRYSQKSALVDKASKLQLYIADVFTKEFNGVHDNDLELGHFYAKTILTNNKWKFKQITRSQLDWIQIMLDVNKGNGFNLPAIEKYLGLKASKNIADPQAPPHEYKVTLKLTGVAVIVGGYFGKITVEKINGQKWKETYRVHFLGGGIDLSPRDEMEGKAYTYHEWLPPDIPGEIRLGELGISFGVSAAAGFMQIFGSGYLPPMDVGYTDLD
ncbi:MAG: peptidoglycan-binding domain-containing protein, partial [Candidatus Binatia bacterium]